MTTATVVIIIVSVILLLLAGGLISMLIVTLPIAEKVYKDTLTRDENKHWGRECSAPENVEQMEMWNTGIKWAETHKENMKEVTVTNDGLKLFGEFFDFGSDRCVVILPGRCECLKYSYYFAKPYEECGMNVLVIDPRAHGLSEGEHSTIGVKESQDLKVWVEYIQNEFSQKEIYFHGICIGSSSGLFLMERDDCPQAVKGMVLEGCYTNFREIYRRHMIVDKRPVFPVLDMIMYKLKKRTGTDVIKQSPIRAVKNINQRALFLFGRQDLFSVPEKSQILFDKCASKNKKIIWFDKGCHSHLRINNVEKYDHAVKEFVCGE